MAESEPLIRANGYIIVHLLLWKQQAPNQQVMIIITHAITHMTVTMTTTVYNYMHYKHHTNVYAKIYIAGYWKLSEFL